MNDLDGMEGSETCARQRLAKRRDVLAVVCTNSFLVYNMSVNLFGEHFSRGGFPWRQ
jgi:hypothetical protein